MIERNRVFTTKGARENRCRPAIDPLFRLAAVAHGNRVIGIILTGFLDDGTSGMMAIKRCGGVCIAQDPDDAENADMPRSVIVNVDVRQAAAISDYYSSFPSEALSLECVALNKSGYAVAA